MKIEMDAIKSAANSTFAIGGVSAPFGSFVVTECSVLRINICAEKPAHRKSAKRYGQPYFL
jgi:predicted benzoate:H+ symporter BenE